MTLLHMSRTGLRSAFLIVMLTALPAGFGQCKVAEVDCAREDVSCSAAGLFSYLLLISPRSNVPDTGLTQCSDVTGVPLTCDNTTYPGRDGFYIDIPSAITLEINASALSVKDSITGLTWQRCPANASNDCTG